MERIERERKEQQMAVETSPACGKVFQVSKPETGKAVRCPACSEVSTLEFAPEGAKIVTPKSQKLNHEIAIAE